MNNQWEGLVATIQKFKKAVKDELDKSNQSFHSDLNGEKPISFKGLAAAQDEPNEYVVEISDVLFWHDPTAYLDEFERWEGQITVDKYSCAKGYLETSEQSNVFSGFVDSLKRKRLAPFVGAGFSKSCEMPLWVEAIQKLIKKLGGVSASEQRAMQPALAYLDEVEKYLEQGNFLQAAELLYCNHKTQLESFIRNTFDLTDSREVRGPVNLLPQLTDGCIVTTNFDGIIERVFSDDKKPIQGYMHGIQSQNQFASKLIQGGRCILKLHGHFDALDTYIFTKNQYDEAYGECENGVLDYTKPLAKVLRQVFVSHSLLFLGCSLEKDRTLELFINVVDSDAFDIPEHYAFLPEPPSHASRLEKEDLLSRAKIRPIWYEVKYDGGAQDHSQLEELLMFAIECASGKAKV